MSNTPASGATNSFLFEVWRCISSNNLFLPDTIVVVEGKKRNRSHQNDDTIAVVNKIMIKCCNFIIYCFGGAME